MACPFQQPPHYRPSAWHCLAQSFPQRQQNPRFGAVVACPFQQPPHYRPSEWHCFAQSFPQRQQNPRFGAVVACGGATVYVDEIHTAFTLPGLRLCDAKSEEPIRPGHSYHAMSAVTGSWSSFRPISQTTAITLRDSRQERAVIIKISPTFIQVHCHVHDTYPVLHNDNLLAFRCIRK